MKSWRVFQVVEGEKKKEELMKEEQEEKKGIERYWVVLAWWKRWRVHELGPVLIVWAGEGARHGTTRMVWLRAAVLHGLSRKGEEFWYCANSSTRPATRRRRRAPHRCLLFFFPFSLCFKQINSKYLKLFFKVEMTFPLGSFAFSKNLQKLVNFYNVSRYFHFAPRWKSRTCPS